MLGFLFAFITAILTSLGNVFSKRSLNDIDKYTLAFCTNLLAAIILLPLLIHQGIPEIDKYFWIALVIGGMINMLTTLLYLTALKESDLSLSIPMLAFTPLFLLITSPLMLKEMPTMIGILGVTLIVIGAYIINIDKQKEGYLEPFKSIIKEKGPRLMLIIAFIWSISSNIDKIGIQKSSATFWIITINLFIPIFILPYIIIKKRESFLADIKREYKIILLLALIGVLAALFQMEAIKQTLVPYVIAIKRTSIVISVILGYLFFKEENIKKRLTGASIMVLGIILIVLS